MDYHSGTGRSLHLRALWLAARECSRESRVGPEDTIESLRERGSFHSESTEGLVQVHGTARRRTCRHIVLLLWPAEPVPLRLEAKEQADKWLSATVPGKNNYFSRRGWWECRRRITHNAAVRNLVSRRKRRKASTEQHVGTAINCGDFKSGLSRFIYACLLPLWS